MPNTTDDRRPSWGPLTLIILVLGVLFGTGGTGDRAGGDAAGKGAASKGTVPPATPLAPASSDFRRPYEDFRWSREVPVAEPRGPSVSPPPTASTSSTPLQPLTAAQDLGAMMATDAIAGRVEHEFLIATVPDPLDTRFAYRFDAVVDVLQMAAEARGWTFDRFWLPWWPSGRQVNDRSELRIPADERAGAPHVRQPGMLLFRKPTRGAAGEAPASRVLIVWLVGETPTAGVAKEALATCLETQRVYHDAREAARRAPGVPDRLLDLRALTVLGMTVADSGGFVPALARWSGASWLGAEPKADTERVIRIVGPNFSGSQTSIEQTIRGWLAASRAEDLQAQPLGRPPAWTIAIRSGSANRLTFDAFEAAIASGAPGTRVHVDSTLIPFPVMMRQLFAFLGRLNGGRALGKVAILAETDTAFGQLPGQEELESWVGANTTVTTMQFPFHIAPVAVAYGQGDGPGKSGNATLVRPSSRLALPAGEMGQPREEVPLLSPATTTPIGEFVTAKLLETVSTEQFRYIGIVASDIRDVIFIARLIRQYSPDVQIFVPGGDLLLGHPQFASELRGMVVVSSYPLFSMAQRWDPPYEGAHRRHLFTDESDEGIYNAAVSLLGQDSSVEGSEPYYDSMYDYGLPFEGLSDASLLWEGRERGGGPDGKQPIGPWKSEGWSFRASAPRGIPSLWFNVVGQRGLWPVQYEWPVNHTPPGVFVASGPPRPVNETQLVRRLVPLMPQFNWHWMVLTLLLSIFAWILFLQQARVTRAARAKIDGSPPPLFRGLNVFRSRLYAARHGRLSMAEAAHREILIVFGLLIFTTVYVLVALRPSWTAFSRSPWPQFLRLDLLGKMPASDREGLASAAMALALSAITLGGLVWTLIRRLALWSPANPRRVLVVLGFLAGVLLAAAARAEWAASRGPAVDRVPWYRLHVAASDNPGIEMILGIGITLLGVALAVFAYRVRNSVRGDVAVLCLIALPIAVWLPWLHRLQWTYTPNRSNGLLSFERAVDFSSGVSPLIPITALMVITLSWVYCQLRRYEKAERFWGSLEAARLSEYPWPIRMGVAGVEAGLRAVVPIRRFVVSSVGTLCLRLGSWIQPAPAPAEHRPTSGQQASASKRRPARKRQQASTKVEVTVQESRFVQVRRFLGASTSGTLIRVGNWVRLHDPATSATGAVDPADSTETSPPRPPVSVERYDPARPQAYEEVRELFDGYLDCARLARMMSPKNRADRIPGLVATGVGLIVLARLIQQTVPVVDFPGITTYLMIVWVWFLGLTVMLALCRFALLWRRLGTLLRQFARLPMTRAYDRLPPAFTRSFGRYLDQDTPYSESLVVPVQQWARVAELFEDEAVSSKVRKAYLETPRKPENPPRSRAALTPEQLYEKAVRNMTGTPAGQPPLVGAAAASLIQQTFQEECKADTECRRSLSEIRTWPGLRDASRACIDLLDPYWQAKPPATGFADRADKPEQDDPGEFPSVEKDETELRAWLRAAEELVALELVTFVSQIGIQLKNLATYLAVAPLLLLLSVSTYPFQPQRLLQFVIWALVLVVVGVVVTVYVSMERDVLLSRVSKTAPNSIAFDRQFLGSVLTFIVPLLTVVVAQFPFFSDTLNQWFEPLARILK
ncbi:MAG: hypothetical protein U0794_10180 [Isosphaeraceae bacterium]